MDFDPLELFTPEPSSFGSEKADVPPFHSEKYQPLEPLEEDEFAPLDVHDLPLLQCKPPTCVLKMFLMLLAPETKRNFDPSSNREAEFVPDNVFSEKGVSGLVPPSMPWLSQYCPRFTTAFQLASVAVLSSSLKANFAAQYNAWLTRIIAHDLEEEVKKLASLRLAENCGRTAQPEILREIEIPYLQRIVLKEPSLTADNLGLKTWGSSFVLGCRLARAESACEGYLHGAVLELGAGTGLVGMVACLLGYATTLTDLPEITPNLKDNVELNNVEGVCHDLDWADPAGFLEAFPGAKYSTIILSDPLYSAEHYILIVNMVNMFLDRGLLSRVLIEIPQRRNYEKERAMLWDLMVKNGYVVEEEQIEDGYDDFGETSFVFRKYVRS